MKENEKIKEQKSPASAENWLVQKSSPLLELWKSPLTLTEFKILDLYLSRIDSRKPEQRWVRFEKGELEHLLGVSQIKINDLKRRLRNLYIPVDLPQIDNLKKWHTISLFEQAVCTADDDGVWQIDLQCTQSAMKYIFNVENIGYLRYKLRTICSLTSRYSYILFLYLERNRFRGTWTEDLETLKEILGCTAETYTAYKRFNQQILQRCQKELSAKAECDFTYEPMRHGRAISKIKFTVLQKEISSESEKQYEEIPAPEELEDDNTILFFLDACPSPVTGEPEFTEDEMKHLLAILRTVPVSKLPVWTPGGDYKFALFHYLNIKFTEMNLREKTTPIENRFRYLRSIILKDTL